MYLGVRHPSMHLSTVHKNCDSCYNIGHYLIRIAHNYHLMRLHPTFAQGQGHIFNSFLSFFFFQWEATRELWWSQMSFHIPDVVVFNVLAVSQKSYHSCEMRIWSYLYLDFFFQLIWHQLFCLQPKTCCLCFTYPCVWRSCLTPLNMKVQTETVRPDMTAKQV